MPKLIKPLTVSQVKNAKATDKLIKLSDGGGLALWVYPTGAKSWKLSFKDEAGKQQTIALGKYPDYSLAEAREWRDDIRKKRAHGNEVMKQVADDLFLFESVAKAWHERWKSEKSDKYAAQVLSALERWIFPKLGNRDIRKITTPDVVAALDLMEAKGIADTLRKTKNNLRKIFSYAVARGMIEFNPVLQIDSDTFKKPESEHMAALSPAELPMLIDFLEQRGKFANPTNRLKLKPTTRLAIYWLLLTMTRVQETCLMQWSEIDERKKIWLIAAERKKERREHIVPLSTAMFWILEQAKAINVGGKYVFESDNFKSHIDKDTPRAALRGAGLDTTAHGLRSLARTYLREEIKIANDVGEKLLAHSLGTKTQTAYNRAELLKERTKALEKWGNIILRIINKNSK